MLNGKMAFFNDGVIMSKPNQSFWQRKTTALLGALAIGLGSSLASLPAHAAAPMVKTAAPGFFRMMLGSFEITALSDGTLDLPVDQILLDTTPEQVKAALAAAYLSNPVETSVSGYLINTGSKLILIDTGTAGAFGPTGGKLLANLKASGYTPEQVDEIYITHFHMDHIGGLIAAGQRAFPNALVRADQGEGDYWLSSANLDQAKDEAKGSFKSAMVTLEPYQSAGKFKPFAGNAELVPGVRALATHGHTPGHAAYLVENGGQTLLVVGDMIHVGAMQFPDPKVTVNFDKDSPLARKVRLATFADAAKQGWWVAAAHISFPGIGHLRARGAGYDWVPVNHTELNGLSSAK
jgi:glyoxylase-like metal-dependent hydrolase (beta-lactamase superfamily II)